MAKIRVMSNQRRVGRVGDTTYYVRDGEQIARQSQNNSNYGDTASRTPAQMARRVKWANLVNLFKGMKSWQPKAYDFKKKGQTDYNLFMALNINSAKVCLTKDMAMNGCGCWEAYQISRGSLAPIGLVAGSTAGTAVTNIKCNIQLTSSTTIGALSAEIIEKNPMFLNGDNIAIIGFWTVLDERGYPYSGTDYEELTLDTTSQVTLSDAGLWNYISTSSSSTIQLDQQTVTGGTTTHMVAIHTRKDSTLQVSTQALCPVNDIYSAQFIGDEWEKLCISTYGLDGEVPLEPGSGGGGQVVQSAFMLRQADLGGSKTNLLVSRSGALCSFRLPTTSSDSCIGIAVSTGEVTTYETSEVAETTSWPSVQCGVAVVSSGVYDITLAGQTVRVSLNDNTLTPPVTEIYV